MTEIAIYFRIMKLTRAKFGHIVNLHLFRDCAATSTATEDPEHAHINKSILGHATLSTSERHYNHARSREALRRHQALILKLRREATREPIKTQHKIKSWKAHESTGPARTKRKG
jgi:hypothetical protein